MTVRNDYPHLLSKKKVRKIFIKLILFYIKINLFYLNFDKKNIMIKTKI
jgi:hypothetical protein